MIINEDGDYLIQSGFKVPISVTTFGEQNLRDALCKEIDEYGYALTRQTNVMAKMTDWFMTSESFRTVALYALQEAKHADEQLYFNENIPMYCHAIWGARYESNDYCKRHTHHPHQWSFTYYPYVPENAPGLILEDLTIEVKTGTFILFPGYVHHEVDKGIFSGYRYCVAGNLDYDPHIVLNCSRDAFYKKYEGLIA